MLKRHDCSLKQKSNLVINPKREGNRERNKMTLFLQSLCFGLSRS